jgi:hypothetical protein
MEQQPNDKLSTRSEAIAALLAATAGAGTGYALWLATGSIVLGLLMGPAVATLVNNFVRGRLRRAK